MAATRRREPRLCLILSRRSTRRARSAALDRAPGDEHLVALVAVLELFLAQVVGAQPLQKCGRREHVAVGLDLDVGAAERLAEQAAERLRGEAPVLAPAVAVVRAHLADAGNGREQHAART